MGWESGAAAITAAIAQTSGAADDDLVPSIVARTLWFTHRSIFLVALHGLLAEEDREQLVLRLRVSRRPEPTTSSPAGWGSTARAADSQPSGHRGTQRSADYRFGRDAAAPAERWFARVGGTLGALIDGLAGGLTSGKVTTCVRSGFVSSSAR